MGVIVKPAISIAGRRVACTAEDIDRAPVAIEGFTIKWGRDEYASSDSSPATVEIQVLDTVGYWADRIRTGRALGVSLEIEWTGEITPGGGSIGPVKMFRGRIQKATARPHSLETADGRAAWHIVLVAADPTANFGNNLVRDKWPAESMNTRREKIRNIGLAAGSDIVDVEMWPGHENDLAAPVDLSGTSGLALLGDFYQSMSNETYAYDAEKNVIRQSIRLSQTYTTKLATFDDNLGAVIPVASDISWGGNVFHGIGLGGCELEGEPEITADPSTDINRIEVSYSNAANEYEDETEILEEIQPGSVRRTQSFSTWLATRNAVLPIVRNALERAREEGRRPRHPDFTVSPGFEFVSERVARWILATHESIRPAFISGNAAFLWLLGDAPAGYSPVVAPIGGETTFDPIAGWSVLFSVHWVHNKQPIQESPATWNAIKQIRVSYEQPNYPWWYPLLGIEPPAPVAVGEHTPERDILWGDGPGYHFGESVTWGDMQHISESGTQVEDILE